MPSTDCSDSNSLLQVPDTPMKAGHINPAGVNMSADYIRECVNQELRNVRFCSTDDFLHHLLGVPLKEEPLWTSVIDHVLSSAYNNKESRWNEFPINKSREAAYYKPFVDLANMVCTECSSIRKDQDALDGCWVDTHSKSPGERSNNTSRIQPDIVHVAFPRPIEEVTEDIDKVTCLDPDDEEIQKKLQFLWQQIHIAVEVKKDEPSAYELNDHVLQLCSYMRQMFQEQLDRRFIISMLLCGDQLYLWLLDRAGLVGTWDRLNIHETPRRFVQILAAVSLLPAQKLGWDPTMRLYINGDSLPSYRLPERIRGSPGSNLFRDNWIISVPTNDNKREEFLTIRLIDGERTQMLCSRATVVWEVIKLSALPNFIGKNKSEKDLGGTGAEEKVWRDFSSYMTDVTKSYAQVHVLKQMWHQVPVGGQGALNVPEEAEMYAKAGGQRGFLVSAEYIHVDGELSSTVNFRKSESLKYLDSKCAEPNPKNRKQKLRDETIEPFYDTDTLAPLKILLNRSGMTMERVQARLLMNETGYPFTYSVSCLELLSALRDCVRTHKQVYMHGVLHRDIGLRNLLVKDNGRGQLIDLDHAKYEEAKKQVFNTTNPSSATDPRLDELQTYLAKSGFQVDVDSGNFILQYFPQLPGHKVGSLLENIIDHRFGKGPTTFTLKDFGWPNEEQRKDYRELPNFMVKEAQGFIRTGTMRYMSWQVLLQQSASVTEPFVHEAYHDIESFFWVIVYICITREGPGGNRRIELQDEESNLSTAVDIAFNSDPENMQELGRTRRDYVVRGQFNVLMKHFHKDFDDLRDLIKRWGKLLAFTSAYSGPDRDLIHHHTLRLLDEAISELIKKRSPDEEEIENGKREKRRRLWASKRKFPLQRSGMANSTRAAKKRTCQT
ncbi:hypothetical protein AMATHDRAFT_44219 [Amanita thiersii Skay4041]|uniref:Fungal-type protein kinase domain-containing protein n=1 Tax=Amanita thiersii Skay4041 TaxID=703135 RepID=A0A2A9NBL3_9AGAR|nr:hypothetical protein AMATHDRAFT_44219 [Amanita thiersii Skay4041]